MARDDSRIKLPRSWRNNNPGNLRPLSSGMWAGQTDIDRAPGGPFSVFATPISGFRALARNLRTYQEQRRLTSLNQMIGRFAPSSENNVSAYVRAIMDKTSWTDPDAPYPFTDPIWGRELMRAIAEIEGGAGCPKWNVLDIEAGWRAAWNR